MNQVILAGLDQIEARKQEYKTVGVDYWKPWLFLMTDGEPTDREFSTDAMDRLQEALAQGKVTFFPMGVGENANTALLKSYTKDGSGTVLKTEKNQFGEIFLWLCSALAGLPPPIAPRLDMPSLPDFPRRIIEL